MKPTESLSLILHFKRYANISFLKMVSKVLKGQLFTNTKSLWKLLVGQPTCECY